MMLLKPKRWCCRNLFLAKQVLTKPTSICRHFKQNCLLLLVYFMTRQHPPTKPSFYGCFFLCLSYKTLKWLSQQLFQGTWWYLWNV